MAGELPDIEQQFIADVSRWLAGMEAMIQAGREFMENNAESIASVEGLQAGIDHLDGKEIAIGVNGVTESATLVEALQADINRLEGKAIEIRAIVDSGDLDDEAIVNLGSAFSDAGEEASKFADDLKTGIEYIPPLLDSYNAMNETFKQLRESMAEAAEAAERLSEGADEVAQAASDVSNAAKSIEETKTAVGDVGSEMGQTTGLAAKMAAQMKEDESAVTDLVTAFENSAGAIDETGKAAGRSRVNILGWGMSLTTLHWIISGTIEVLAVLIPALVAVGAAADVGLQGFAETGDRMRSLYEVTESLGGAFGVTGGMVYGLKGNLQAAQNAADPQIWELLGEGIKAVGTSSGWFVQMGEQVIQIMDAFGARVDVDMTSNVKQMQSVLGDGARDLAEFGQVLGNLGMAIFSAASQMPGLAEVMLGLLADITRVISVVVQLSDRFRFMGISILTVTMGIEEFMRWGGLLVSMMGGLGIETTALGDKFLSFERFQGVFMSLALAIPNAAVAVTGGLSNMAGGLANMFDRATDAAASMPMVANAMVIAGDGAVSASIGLSEFSEELAVIVTEISLVDAALGVGLVAALVLGILYLEKEKTATQEFIEKLQSAANTATFGQGMIDAANNMQIFSQRASEATQQVAQLGTEQTKALSWHGLQEGTAAAELHSATQAMQEYTQASQQAAQQEGNAISAVSAISQKYGVTLPEALALANTAGLKLGTSLTSNGHLTAVAQQEVAGLVSGYEAMSGSALGLGNNVAAVNTQLGLQGSQLSKVNGAWDQFLANAIGGTQAYATLNDDISTMGNVTTDATSKITSFAQQSTGMSLSVKQISEALKTFGPQSSQVWQNYDSALTQAGTVTDWWRTAAASGTVTGKQMNEAIADTAKQLLPFAANSTTAASQLGVLVQEAGGPALTNYKALKTWIDANSTSQAAYNTLLGDTTTQMANVSQAAAQFSQTMDAMVVTAVEQGSVNLGQITTDAKNYNNALKDNPPLSNAVQNSLLTLVTQLYNTNIGAQNVKTMVQQMGANMHLSASQAKGLADEAYTLYENLSKIHNVNATVNVEFVSSGSSSAQAAVQGGGRYVSAGGHGFASGTRIPGYGGGDIVHAMLEPGEAVVPKHLVGAVAPFLKSHGVPGFAAGGLIHPKGGSSTAVGYQTPMEKVIAQWGGEVWANALKSWGSKNPLSLAELKNVWGPGTFPGTGIWSNPQYRMMRLDERMDMDPYYLKDIAYQKVLGDIASTKSAEAKQIATWKKDEKKGDPAETAYYTNLYKKDAAYDDSQVAHYQALLGQTKNAKLREDYLKDIARYQADATGYDKKAADEKNYYKNLYSADISNLERSDARKVLMYQVEAAEMALRMGYANGGMPFGHYDQGGYLPMGLSMALNTTGRPEQVGGGGSGSGDDQPMHVHLHMDGKEIAQTILPSVVGANSRYNIRNSGRVTGLLRPS